jgi:hypothetical protein
MIPITVISCYHYDITRVITFTTPSYPFSPAGSQLWMLFDSNRVLVGTGDSWPEAVQVKKGKYELRLQVHTHHGKCLFV